MAMIRAEIVFRGLVQGVGFRFTATRIAERLGVCGWVRNEPDGTVRLVVEATREEVDLLLESIDQELPGHVHARECTFSAASGEFSGFRIIGTESHR